MQVHSYVGRAGGPGRTTVVRANPVMGGTELTALRPRHDLRNHSPDGFAWGYGGSGPAQLALAILADATGSDELALQHYQEFKRRVIARLPMDEGFELERRDVMRVVDELEKEASADG